MVPFFLGLLMGKLETPVWEQALSSTLAPIILRSWKFPEVLGQCEGMQSH